MITDTTTTGPDEPEPTEPDDGAADPLDLTPDQMMAECVAIEAEKREWLKACRKIMAGRTHDSDPSSRVQFAADLVYVAAAERAARLLRSDMPDERG